MTKHSFAALYEPLDFFVVRAPLLPIERFDDLCQVTPTSLARPSPAHTSQLLPDDPQVRRALAIGSPALYWALAHRPGNRGDGARLRRKLLCYLIRMSTRPTPYGLFAGVALGEWSARTDLALAGGPLTTRTRPDMTWLTSLVADAESETGIRRAATVLAEPAAFEHGGRIHLTERSGPPHGHPPDVSVRASDTVRRVLSLARCPIRYQKLVAEVLASVPSATPDKIHRLCDELWRHGLLRTDLHPPLTGDPSRHVLDRLPPVPAAAPYANRLSMVLDRATAFDAGDLHDADALTPTSGKAPHDGGETYQVDAALPLAGRTLTKSVAADAARAVDLLLGLHPSPGGPPQLTAYRHTFEVRYGSGRLVPVLELLDPRFGLGPPSRYGRQPGEGPATRAGRTEALAAMLANAQRDHAMEIELNESLLEDLRSWTPTPAAVPPSLELSVFIAAASSEAVDRGEYLLVVGPNLGGTAAGKGLGRFADLLGSAAQAALERAARAEEARAPECVWAELVYAPSQPRAANVAVRPALRAYEIPIGVTPGCAQDRIIRPDELAVCLLDDRLRLWWPTRDVEVKVSAGHMLNTVGAPVLCQFLDDIGKDGVTHVNAFDWGPFSAAPFLPRVRVGRIVLRPASWQLGPWLAGELRRGGKPRPPPASESAAAFSVRLRAWRERWDVPRQVYLAAGDNRLLLDLDHPAHAEQLHDEMRRHHSCVRLEEALPGSKDAWLSGAGGRYMSEVVVPLVRRQTAARIGSPPTARPVAALAVDRRRPPGSDWLFLKLYAPWPRHDALISGPLRAFADNAITSGYADLWFFVRYADPEPHVRLRFHGQPQSLSSTLLPDAASWAGDLTAAGVCDRFTVDVYEREIERYGGELATQAAERLFAADSAATATLLQLIHHSDPVVPDRMTLALLTVDDLLTALGLEEDVVARMCAADRISPKESSAAFRRRKDMLSTLLADRRCGGVASYDSDLRRTLTARREGFTLIAEQLHALNRIGELAVPIEVLARSYVHLHCNRLLGPNPDLERLTLGLLRRLRTSLQYTIGRRTNHRGCEDRPRREDA